MAIPTLLIADSYQRFFIDDKINSVSIIGPKDYTFFNMIFLCSIEKEVHDPAQKTRDSHDTYQKVLELKAKLQQCRDQIQKLNGIDYSKEDQIKRLGALRKQLIMKQDLLLKYRNMCHFDTPK